MSDKVKERIEKDADEYIKQYLPHVDTTGHWLGFQHGATAERPKARNEAIEECIKIVKKRHYAMAFIKELEALKHKQP